MSGPAGVHQRVQSIGTDFLDKCGSALGIIPPASWCAEPRRLVASIAATTSAARSALLR
jgi:hypothetical protein